MRTIKGFSSLLVCVLVALGISSCSDNKEVPTTVDVMSFNIRNSWANDGDNSWEFRKELVTEEISKADVAGLQEVLKDQLDYIAENMPEYGHCGVAREDGMTKGEYSPIVYRKAKFELLDSGTFWLSDTPEVVASVGWDAALTRIATWAKLKTVDTGMEFLFINTHFDHVGVEARKQSALLLMKKAEEMVGDLPSIITGDFNHTPQDEPYAVMTGSWEGYPWFRDARDIAETKHINASATFNGWKERTDAYIIDYVFVSDRVDVNEFTVWPAKKDGRFISDHHAVSAKVALRKTAVDQKRPKASPLQ